MDLFLTLWGTATEPSSLQHILLVTWRIILVILGINALIIVHEWGHFIVARMCGVRCDKFYIWFDAWGFKFFHFKWGDTEYGLGWLPLGGYVKMLGQEDNPGGIKAEIDRAKAEADGMVQESDAETVEAGRRKAAEAAELEKVMYAPDSYLSKSVPQRMAIISAGVCMNIIFAFLCAVAALLTGFPETSSRVGGVLPASPAWESGVRAGDRITRLNGEDVTAFSQIPIAVMNGESVEMVLDRANLSSDQVAKVTTPVTPELRQGGMTPTIGVLPAAARSLAKIDKPWTQSASEEENQTLDSLYGSLTGGDLLTAMNDRELRSSGDYELLLRSWLKEPITFRFEAEDKTEKVITVAPIPFRETGLRLKMGEVTTVAHGSPAEKAGIRGQKREGGQIVQRGDILFAVNNEPILDPIKFPCQIWEKYHAAPGQSARTSAMVLSVLRDGEMVDVPLTVSTDAGYTGFMMSDSRLASSTLGISYEVLPVVGGIDASIRHEQNASPLDGRIDSVLIKLPKPTKDDEDIQKIYESLSAIGKASPDGILIQSNGERLDHSLTYWFASGINHFPVGTALAITIEKADGQKSVIETAIRNADDAFLLDRGFIFGADVIKRRTASVSEAVSFGLAKTGEMMGLVYKFLRHLGGTVSVKALGGPGMIVDAAYQTAASGPGLFLIFLCMISANLAVVNFLPIPVLDGGHIVFLLYEAIFRRPPNENVQIILSYLGLFLILGLMFWVIYLDLQRYVFGGL